MRLSSRDNIYFVALATDYDGTLAEDGVVEPVTLDAIRLLKESGRRAILVTGRELPDLLRVFGEIACFDLVVAENGALLYDPATGEESVLGAEPPAIFSSSGCGNAKCRSRSAAA